MKCNLKKMVCHFKKTIQLITGKKFADSFLEQFGDYKGIWLSKHDDSCRRGGESWQLKAVVLFMRAYKTCSAYISLIMTTVVPDTKGFPWNQGFNTNKHRSRQRIYLLCITSFFSEHQTITQIYSWYLQFMFCTQNSSSDLVDQQRRLTNYFPLSAKFSDHISSVSVIKILPVEQINFASSYWLGRTNVRG